MPKFNLTDAENLINQIQSKIKAFIKICFNSSNVKIMQIT